MMYELVSCLFRRESCLHRELLFSSECIRAIMCVYLYECFYKFTFVKVHVSCKYYKYLCAFICFSKREKKKLCDG